MNFNIHKERKKIGLTQKELADKLGVSYQTIQNWESGKVIPKSKNKMLQDFFLNFKDVSTDNNLVIEPITGYYYPDVNASAGLENKMENDELLKIPVNIPGWGKNIEFINVYGDSMYPKYCSGEIIGIKEVEPQYINFGYAYVVVFNDGQVFLKYIRKGKDEEHWLLASENPKYEDREYHLSLIRKVYIVKGVITKTTM